MTSKLINRYVIKDENGEIITKVDDIKYKHLALNVYDREEEINIAKMNINDRELNYLMATSVIEAINNYTEVEEVTEEP